MSVKLRKKLEKKMKKKYIGINYSHGLFCYDSDGSGTWHKCF